MIDPWIFWLITLAMASGGAWFGSYLREKGKNYATKEDVQTLTRLTEKIRADISGTLWLKQKRWDLKRDYYWELLAEINAMAIALRAVRSILNLEDMKPEQLATFSSQLNARIQRVQEHDDALVRLLGIGRILLSNEIVTLLDSYQQDLRQLEKEASASMNVFQLPKHEIDAMSDADRTAYTEKVVKEFPGTIRQIIDNFRTKHTNVMPEIIRAARNDLLSFREVAS